MNTAIKNIFLFWIFWVFLATVLAWSGMFFGRIFWIVLGTSVFWVLWRYSENFKIRNIRWNAFSLLSWLFIGSFILANIFFFQYQTLFTGRDQGSIAQASFFLAQHHSLSFSLEEAKPFFEIYGEGKALHFPGFFYTQEGNLTTQFPHPTLAWYGSLLSLGIPAPWHISIGNAITLSLFIFAFYSIVKTLTQPKTALLFTILILFTFPLWWFARFSLSENVMLASLWITLFFFFRFFKRPHLQTFFPLILTLSLLLIVRIEGIIFATLLGGVILLYKPLRSFLFCKPFPLLWTAFPILILTLAFFLNQPFYATVSKAILQTLGFLQSPQTEGFIAPYSFVDLWSLFLLYGIAPIFLLACIGSIALFRHIRKRKLSQNEIFVLLLLIILSPSLLYFAFPFISPDHPWMFRRFVFASLPLLLFLIAFTLHTLSSRLSDKKFSSLVFGIIIIIFLSQLPAFLHFFSIRQEYSLFEQTQAFAQNFTKGDVLFVDKEVSESGFSMIPGVLRMENIKSVYFFNPEDFATIDYSLFGENNNVYFLVNENTISRYSQTLDESQGQEVFFSSNRLKETPSDTLFSFPKMETYEAKNLLFQIY